MDSAQATEAMFRLRRIHRLLQLLAKLSYSDFKLPPSEAVELKTLAEEEVRWPKG